MLVNKTALDRMDNTDGYTTATTVNQTSHYQMKQVPYHEDILKELQSQLIVKNGTVLTWSEQGAISFDEQLRTDEFMQGSELGAKTYNQMLPIYCSIMGLIIVFLLFYVVYKLWKQREAIADGKLATDTYLLPGCNGTKCTLPVSRSGHRSGSGSNKLELSGGTAFTNRIGQPSPSNSEWDPLLVNGNVEAHSDKLLRALPPHTLGRFSCGLAEKDWRNLAAASKNFLHIEDAARMVNDSTKQPTYAVILQAAIQAQDPNADKSTDENLSGAAKLVTELCTTDPPLTLRNMCRMLKSVGYQDLISILLDAQYPAPDPEYTV